MLYFGNWRRTQTRVGPLLFIDENNRQLQNYPNTNITTRIRIMVISSQRKDFGSEKEHKNLLPV